MILLLKKIFDIFVVTWQEYDDKNKSYYYSPYVWYQSIVREKIMIQEIPYSPPDHDNAYDSDQEWYTRD